MFRGFETRRIDLGGIRINCRTGGQGPGLLLLHGHPQTHVIWHKVAEQLAQSFTVVAADLRGYGDSDKPAAADGAPNYSKRVMAADQVALMQSLGFERFMVIGHVELNVELCQVRITPSLLRLETTRRILTLFSVYPCIPCIQT